MVYDMRRSVAFYCDVLGFELLEKWEPDGHLYWAKLKAGDDILMLNAEFEDELRPPAEPTRRDGDRMTLYFGCPSADEAYQYLCSRGIPVKEPETAFYGMRQLLVRDPDGFQLCFQHPV
jgi:catechol 2,3-dioxygenase-like lactoylglutathione lyase family enzyme